MPPPPPHRARGGRISTGSASPTSRGGQGNASGLSTWPVSFIGGAPCEHATKLGERLTHANAVRAQRHLPNAGLMRAAAPLDHGQRAANRPTVFKIAKE